MAPAAVAAEGGDASAPPAAQVRRAAEALRAGHLVVFPTETVYGLGACASDPAAVARIFEAKGRPADNPLIVHVADAAAARGLTIGWTRAAQLLANAFWPGPLTLVLPKAPHVPDITTGGLDSVAVRVPAHPLARALLQEADVPVAAPSANVSGRPSPTRVQDARADLGDAVAVYLDGGPTDIGLESTVVDVRDAPVVLRLGAIPRRAIEQVVGPLAAEGEAARSPGTRHRHYAPTTPLHVVAPADMASKVAAWPADARLAIVCSQENAPKVDGRASLHIVAARDDVGMWAHRIFALLRDLDAAGHDAILVEEPPRHGVGEAVRDRLRRAAEA